MTIKQLSIKDYYYYYYYIKSDESKMWVSFHLGPGFYPCYVYLVYVCHKVKLIPFTDWAYNAHSAPFEQSNSAHYVPSL